MQALWLTPMALFFMRSAGLDTYFLPNSSFPVRCFITFLSLLVPRPPLDGSFSVDLVC